MEDFDHVKVFMKYFVKNNVEAVLQSFNRSRKQKATVIKLHQQNARKKKNNMIA